MIRVFNMFVPTSFLLLALADAGMLGGAMIVCLSMSYATLNIVLTNQEGHLHQIAIFTIVTIPCLFMMGLYERKYLLTLKVLCLRILIGLGLSFLCLMTIFYVAPGIRIWMSALFPAFAGSSLALLSNRVVLTRIASISSLKNRVLVLGTGPQAQRVERAERELRPANFIVLGFAPVEPCSTCVAEDRVVRANDLLSLSEALRADEIVVALEHPELSLPRETLLQFRLRGIRILDTATFFEREFGQLEIDRPYPNWLLFSNGSTMGRFETALKRTFDVSVSLSFLLFAFPLLCFTALAVKIEDGGPIFYRQERVGLNGRKFSVIKFRSMRVDAEKDGVARWASINDPRVTFIGAIIRKIRIDEIPQIFNVLRGEMSFVGPRPERPTIVNDLIKDMSCYPYRHIVKPGITGWAQVNYPYGASIADAREKLKFDLYYVKNCSLMLDLIILLQTVRVVIWPQGVR
jgi:sugar transferase (PEP-CTERM system associated)